ncbi:hypothetical protein HK103_007149 [Boothiomyces macroporosus]|uniref:tRNA (guanine(46)-N(7))-methyltransferase n=1 Tax=Boothiomyces macroporosus TaxID=261099 RepID=A0AAD5UGI3_9FUNG|nr:hypothetical protein HK103_007149 [Boothiomyces macroporosus]
MEEKLKELEGMVLQWKEQFTSENNREPTGADFPKEILDYKNEMLELYKTLAPPPTLGGCTHFIKRKQRYCSRQATIGTGFCSTHRDAQVLEPVNLTTTAIESTTTAKKKNLKRPPKRMLNPFFVNEVLSAPDWTKIYDDITKPLCLDIGCAKGGYIQQLRNSCRANSGTNNPIWRQLWNFLGIELFGTLADAANRTEQERYNSSEEKFKDLYYIGANINNSLMSLEIPNLQRVTFLFPDPWSCGTTKVKNKKRRVMSKEFATNLAKLLAPGAEVYFASDWHELALDIRNHLLSTNCFDIPCSSEPLDKTPKAICPYPYVPTLTAQELLSLHEKVDQESAKKRLIDTQKNFEKSLIENSTELWLSGIPFGGVMTERDLVCENQWRTVYRLVVVRNKNSI